MVITQLCGHWLQAVNRDTLADTKECHAPCHNGYYPVVRTMSGLQSQAVDQDASDDRNGGEKNWVGLYRRRASR